MTLYKAGTRVFFVTRPEMIGTVIDTVYTKEGIRHRVYWHDTKVETHWDPAFLFPEGTPMDDIPGVIHSGIYTWYKSTNTLTKTLGRREYRSSKRH